MFGVLILRKKYTREKYASVILITIGIVIWTIYTNREKSMEGKFIFLSNVDIVKFYLVLKECDDCNVKSRNVQNISTNQSYWFVIGIILSLGTLVLSAVIGIFQEQLYKKYGKLNKEVLYYTVSNVLHLHICIIANLF